ncbi:hypothetical protein ACFE04_030752 [Oxalis oulophora]
MAASAKYVLIALILIITTTMKLSSSMVIGNAFVYLSCDGGAGSVLSTSTTDNNGTFTIYFADSNPIIFDPNECGIYTRLPFRSGNCRAFGSQGFLMSNLILVGLRPNPTGSEAILTCNGFRFAFT